MVNIRSKIGQHRQAIILLKLMTNIETKFSKQVNNILKRRYSAAAASVRTGNARGASGKMTLFSEELRKIFERFYLVTASTFGEMFLASYREDRKKSFRDIFETKGRLEETFFERMRQWAKEEAAKKVKIIDKNSSERVAKIISDAIEEGTSHFNIAKIIQEKEELSLWEALRIARTETHTCANESTRAAAQSTEITWKKYWVSSGDDRTRETHIQAAIDYSSDNAIPMDDYYEVGESSLLFPGDPDGDAEEIINCRCVELYIEADAANMEEAV